MRRSSVVFILLVLALGCPDGAHGNTWVVSSTADTGPATLRAYIGAANASVGPDTIVFDPGLSGTITLATDLPALSDDEIHIWGETAVPGNPMPDIVLSSGGATTGIFFAGNNCTVRGLEFTGFDTAIWLRSVQSNIVGGGAQEHINIIRGNGTGILLEGLNCEANFLVNNRIHSNAGTGIHLRVGAKGNIIGGFFPFSPNLSSNNGGFGIHLDATPDPIGTDVSRNQILGNIVGMTRDGLSGWGNGMVGILLESPDFATCDSNRVFRNLVSDNTGHGIVLVGDSTFANEVSECKVGTDEPGTSAFGNGGDGVLIINGAHDNTIGPDNLVSANQRDGVRVDGMGCDRNLVVGSTIGLDISGTAALGNDSCGVHFMNACKADTVRDCLVSANGNDGILLENLGTHNHVVELNYVGSDVTGRLDFNNGGTGEGGILLNDGPNYCLVDRNLVVGHTGGYGCGRYGICLRNDTVMHNIVSNNVVGLDIDTANPIPNYYGVLFEFCVADTIGPGNVISGNDSYGILLDSGSAHRVFGNRIGTDSTGLVAFGNKSGIFVATGYSTIGGPSAAEGNLISANDEWGVEMHNWTTPSGFILVQNNVVGEDAAGGAMGNGSGGIWVGYQYQYCEIGDTLGTTGNTIANNGQNTGSGAGVLVGEEDFPSEYGNIIGGNSITNNAGKGIDLQLDLIYPGNEAIPAPTVISATTAEASGTYDSAITDPITIQVFVDTADEGEEYIGNATLSAPSDWEYVFTTPPAVGSYVTATITGLYNTAVQTSEFSNSVEVSPTGTDVAEDAVDRVDRLELTVLTPGSSSGETTVRFSTSVSMHARFRLYDVTGRMVRQLREGVLPAGITDIRWDGRDSAGHTVASGVYFLEAVHEEGRDVRKVTVVR